MIRLGGAVVAVFEDEFKVENQNGFHSIKGESFAEFIADDEEH